MRADWTMMEEVLWTSLPSSLLYSARKVYRAQSALRDDTKTKAKRRTVFDAFFFQFFSPFCTIV